MGILKQNILQLKLILQKKQINNAYKLGTKKVKFDLTKDIAEEYEDNKIDKKNIKKLRDLGFKYELDEEDEQISLMPDDFLEIYLFIVYLGDNNFKYKLIEPINDDQINIGGYGLFF